MQRDVDVAHGTWARIGRKEDKFRPGIQHNTQRKQQLNTRQSRNQNITFPPPFPFLKVKPLPPRRYGDSAPPADGVGVPRW